MIAIIELLFAWFDQGRSFFKSTNGGYITMWKRWGGTCYLIPGKYYGVKKPNDGYIETSNQGYFTIYSSNRLPNVFLIKKETQNSYKAINPIDNHFLFEDYMSNEEKYESIIYKENAKKISDINGDASFLSIDILDGSATDERGETQRDKYYSIIAVIVWSVLFF